MKKDWTYKKLGEVCTSEASNIALNKIADNVGDYPLFGASGYAKSIDFYKQANEYIGIVKDGAGVGRVGIYPAKSSLVGTMQYILPKSDVLLRYLYYVLKGLDLSKLVSGATIPHIYFKDYSKFSIPIPPLSIQRSIVAELDLLHSVISKKKEQLRELDNLAQSLFYQMFGDIHNKMHLVDVVPLKDVFSLITDGTHQTPIYTDDKINGFKFLSAKDVVSGVIDWSRTKYIPRELHEELHKRLSPRRNDILLCKNGTTGICALVETDEVFDIYVSLALLRPKDGILPIYLVYAINNPSTKEQFNSSLKGVGVPNLHLGEIKKAKIPLPPLSLQQSFAAKVEAIEAQKQAITQSIKETEALLAQRMDTYFS